MMMTTVMMAVMIRYDQVDVEVEDRGLIALSILVGKLQAALNNALGITTTPRPRPILGL